MEETEAKETGLEFIGLFVAFVEEGLVELAVGTTEIGLEELGSFVGDFDGSLEDAFGNDLLEGEEDIGRLRGDKDSEVLVRGGVGEDVFEEAFKTVESGEPCLHKMHILQHNPFTLLGAIVDCLFSDLFLSLSHGNIDEAAIFGGDVVLLADTLDIRSGVDSGEEDEEGGRAV